jgi:hypothetical protein
LFSETRPARKLFDEVNNMKRTILAAALILSCGLIGLAQDKQNKKTQTRTSGSGSSQSSASANKNVSLDAGTRLAADLQTSLDASKAKVGDQVVFKTTQAIKSEGHTVVDKGSRLVGHVTEVTRRAGSDSESRIGLLFDRLENGSLTVPISATISSLVSGTTSLGANDDQAANDTMIMSSSSASSSSSAQRSSSGGSLVGGVTNTVGGVANTATSTVGSAVGTTTGAVGSTVNSTSNTLGSTTSGLGRIQISQSANASAEGGSVLSLQGRNLRLEKGTHFNLVLNQSANVSKEQ